MKFTFEVPSTFYVIAALGYFLSFAAGSYSQMQLTTDKRYGPLALLVCLLMAAFWPLMLVSKWLYGILQFFNALFGGSAAVETEGD